MSIAFDVFSDNDEDMSLVVTHYDLSPQNNTFHVIYMKIHDYKIVPKRDALVMLSTDVSNGKFPLV